VARLESKIPLHRAGFTVFAARIISIFTGMVFLIMITGWLTPPRFGFWEVIVSFVTFASYPSGWLSFWATREVARGGFVARTAILLNLVLSLGGTVVFFLIAGLSSALYGPNLGTIAFAALLVPLSYWTQASNAVAGGMRPTAIGYSTLISEIAKLAVAYPALFVFKLEVNGVILAVLTSYAVQAAVTTVMVREAGRDGVSLALGRKWLADAWIPATYSLAGTILAADTVIAWLASGAFVVTGYYQAAYQIGILVSYANFLSYALYPILLRGGSEDAANVTLDFIMMFGVPMAFGVIALAPNLLTILRSDYTASGSNVSTALGILAISSLMTGISGFLDATLTGSERADLAENRGFGAYKKSNFVFVSMANLSYATAYVAGVFLTVKLELAAGLGLPTVVETWAVVQLMTVLAAVLVKFRKLARTMKIRVPRSLGEYLVLSALMAMVLYALSTYVPLQSPERLVYGLRVMGLVVAGALLYFGLLVAMDKRVRELAKAFLRLIAGGRAISDRGPEKGVTDP